MRLLKIFLFFIIFFCTGYLHPAWGSDNESGEYLEEFVPLSVSAEEFLDLSEEDLPLVQHITNVSEPESWELFNRLNTLQENILLERISFKDSPSLDLEGISLNFYLIFRIVWSDNLKYLDLSRTNVGDRSLEFLPRGLHHLFLDGCLRVTNNGLSFIPEDLKNLSLNGCIRITDKGLPFLPNSLKSVSLLNTRVSEESTKILSSNLKDSRISYVKISEKLLLEIGDDIYKSVSGEEFIGLDASLHGLVYHITSVLGSESAELFEILNSSSENLSLESISFTDTNSLNLENITFNLDHFSLIQWPEDLVWLNLSNTNIEDQYIQYLPETLNTLHLSNCLRITHKGLESWPENLENIFLLDTRIPIERFKCFFPEIRVTHTYARIEEGITSDIGDFIYESVSADEFLNVLDSSLYGLVQHITGVSQQESQELFNLLNTFQEGINLESISFADTGSLDLSNISLNFYVPGIKWPISLQHLDLSGTEVGNKALGYLPNLLSLTLDGCIDIRGEGLRTLPQSLQYLSLCKMRIIDQDLQELQYLLEKDLCEVNINECGSITQDGVDFLLDKQGILLNYRNCSRITESFAPLEQQGELSSVTPSGNGWSSWFGWGAND